MGGKGDQEIAMSRTEPDWEFCGQVLPLKKGELEGVVKVHNTLKVGDSIEVVRPNMDILKFKLNKMVDAKNDKEIKEAHGGAGGQTIIIETKEEIPKYSVFRRRIK